jgi:hypothetical protein
MMPVQRGQNGIYAAFYSNCPEGFDHVHSRFLGACGGHPHGTNLEPVHPGSYRGVAFAKLTSLLLAVYFQNAKSERSTSCHDGIRHLRSFNGSRNAGFSAAVSDFALIVPEAIEASRAQFGIKPQRMVEI